MYLQGGVESATLGWACLGHCAWSHAGRWPLKTSLMLQQEGSVISCREQEWWAWPPAIMTHELRKNKEEHTLSLKQAKMNPKRWHIQYRKWCSLFFCKEVFQAQGPFLCSLSSVQSLSHVRLFATPRIAARQASLSITNSRSSLELTSIKSVMPSSHLILGRPLDWLISLQSKGLSRVFSNTTVQKHQFFSTQLFSQSNSYIHTWPQEKQPWLDRPLLAK